MSPEPLDARTMDEYAVRAREEWGATSEWEEYERKSAGRTREDDAELGSRMMQLFVPFGEMAARGDDPAGKEAVAQAARVQAFITEHFYRCSDAVFAQLGEAYGAGGEFTRNIDAAAGTGAAEFASRSVAAYVAGRV